MTATKFKTIKDATDMILLMDFKLVVAYKMEYQTGDDGEYWIVKRKILQSNSFGKAIWVAL